MDDLTSMVGEETPQVNQAPVESEEVQGQATENKEESKAVTPEDAIARLEAKLERVQAKYDKRIGRTVAEKKALQEELAQVKGYIAQATQRQPQKSDFKSQAEWDAWVMRQTAQSVLNENSQKQTQAQAQAAQQQEMLQDWSEKVKAVLPRIPDFHAVVGESEIDFEKTPDVFQAILESDVGAEMAYFLAKNPEEATKITRLGKDARQRYLARIEFQLEQQAKTPQAKAPKPTSPARVNGQAPVTMNPATMPWKDYKALRDSGKNPW